MHRPRAACGGEAPTAPTPTLSVAADVLLDRLTTTVTFVN